jgi:hypothetical protein
MENLENDRIEELDVEGKQDAALEKAGVRYCDECHAVRLTSRFPNNGTICDECCDIICQICKGNMPRSREEIGYCEECELEIQEEKTGHTIPKLIIYDELIPQVQAKAIQSLKAEMLKADSVVISNEQIANLSAHIGLKYFADGTLFVPGGQQ